MTRSQYPESGVRPGITYHGLAVALAVVTVGALMSGCAAAPDQSFLKVESGDRTLLDVRKNANDNVQIEVGVPRVSVAQRQADAEERLEIIEPQPQPVTPPALSPLEQQRLQENYQVR